MKDDVTQQTVSLDRVTSCEREGSGFLESGVFLH